MLGQFVPESAEHVWRRVLDGETAAVAEGRTAQAQVHRRRQNPRDAVAQSQPGLLQRVKHVINLKPCLLPTGRNHTFCTPVNRLLHAGSLQNVDQSELKTLLCNLLLP